MTMLVCRKATMACREELLQSIKPGMKLDKAFFLKVYGYEITWPGFAETAIKALEGAGCSKARKYYEDCVIAYKAAYRKEIKPVAAWYVEECRKKQKGSEELRRRKIEGMSRSELTELCRKFLQKGIIKEPEQFPMVVGLDQ